MKCKEYDLVALLKGELETADAEKAQAHAAECSACRAEVAKLEKVIGVFRKMERVEPSRDFNLRVRQAFVAANPEFIEAQRAAREPMGLWASLKKQFSYVPAWALSIAAHIFLMAIAAILLFTPDSPEDEMEKRIDVQVPKNLVEKTPKFGEEGKDGGMKGRPWATIKDGGLEREFTKEETDVIRPGKWKDERDFSGNPFDPRGWDKPDETIKKRWEMELDNARVVAGVKHRLRRENHEQGTTIALSRALKWLADAQLKTGAWPSLKLKDENFQVGVTGLALLALLGDGHTHKGGQYEKQVKLGLEYLLRQQDNTGLIGIPDKNYMYDHAIAATALLEAYLITKDKTLRGPVSAAVTFTIRAQNQNGGWGYVAGSDENDTSVMGWQILLLRLYRGLDAYATILPLNQAAIRLHAATNPANGQVGYRGMGQYPNGPKALTAVGMFSHILSRSVADPHVLDRQSDVLLGQGLPRVHRDRKDYRKNNFYYWYFGSLAMFQKGGKAWKTWHDRLVGDLVKAQHEKGSWPADFDLWSPKAGQVYTTAMAALILETYYRYPRFLR